MEAFALLVYLLVFVLLVVDGQPGLGLGQGFYLAIVLVALAGGPWTGAAAGVLAAVLFAGAELVGHEATLRNVWAPPLEVRLGWYVLAGTAVGYFARRVRHLLGQSLHVLDDLLGLARREVTSGALTREGFEARVADRASGRWPFAVLVGTLAAPSDGALRTALGAIAGGLSGEDDVACVGDRFAVVASATSAEDARELAAEVERVLDAAGFRATFGWAFHPQDGADALALFGRASERLQARRHALGEDEPAAIVTELRPRSA